MSSLPPASEQAHLVRSVKRISGFSLNEHVFVISTVWLRKWKEYTGFGSKIVTDEPPPPIDNSKLVINGKLRRTVTQKEYDVVSKSIWDFFYNWYGGGPIIQLEVAFDPIRKINVPVLFDTTYRITCDCEVFEISLSKYRAISELKLVACAHFRVDPARYGLRIFSHRNPGEFLQDSYIASEYMLNDDQELLLDEISNPTEYIPSIEIKKSKTDEKKKKFSDFDAQMRSSSLADLSSYTENNNVAYKGLCGLQNIGNTCYMNSILQCLMHIPVLVDYFLSNHWRDHINSKNSRGTEGDVVSAFAMFMKTAWSGEKSAIAPRDFKNAFARHATEFSGHGQHDAHEFLILLLDFLHEDLNKANENNIIEILNGDGTNDDEIYQRTWEIFKMKNDSIIIDNFYGIQKTTMKCTCCQKKITIFEPYSILSLPVPCEETTSPHFLFVPANPLCHKRQMNLKNLPQNTATAFTSALSKELKREVNLVFAIFEENNQIRFIPHPRNYPSNCELVVFEVTDPSKLYVVANLCFYVPGRIRSKRKIVEGPFLVEIPNEDANQHDLQIACERFFQYLWLPCEDGESTIINQDLYDMVRVKVKNKRYEHRRIIVHVSSSSFFDRNSRFKPSTVARCISNRTIKICLNTKYLDEEYDFNWCRLHRPTVELLTTSTEHNEQIKLEDCFELHQHECLLDKENKWQCPECNKFVDAVKDIKIHSLPECLIIQLKRFAHLVGGAIKVESNVKYPDILDLTKYNATGEDMIYKLVSVCEHMGSLRSGHYITRAKVDDPDNSINDKWYVFNDISVRQCTQNSAHTKNAYLLFYQRINK